MTEEEIVKSIGSGGRLMDAAVKALYDTKARRMLRFFVGHGLSGDEAKDVLQNTFVNIVRGAANFKGDVPAALWIRKIAKNCLTNHFRPRRSDLMTHVEVLGEEDWQEVLETTAAPEVRVATGSVDECVNAGLQKFADKMPSRAYVLTLQMDGLSIVEIGNEIGRSVAATKEYLSQCKKKIQPYIAHCTELLEA